MRNIEQENFTIQQEDILIEAIEVWKYWKERDAQLGLIRRAIKPYILEILAEIKKLGIVTKYLNRMITFSDVDERKAKKIQAYLMSRRFREGDLKLQENLEQMSMEDVPGFWQDND
jgi:hypothetical protein